MTSVREGSPRSLPGNRNSAPISLVPFPNGIAAGGIFAFILKKFVGSNLAFNATSRDHCSGL